LFKVIIQQSKRELLTSASEPEKSSFSFVGDVYLQPCRVIATTIDILSVNFILEPVLRSLLVTRDHLGLHVISFPFKTKLIVHFDLEVLVRVVKREILSASESYFFVMHFVGPPSLQGVKSRLVFFRSGGKCVSHDNCGGHIRQNGMYMFLSKESSQVLVGNGLRCN
jgi:hypothetical protein